MQKDFSPSSREQHVAIYDPHALPAGFPIDPDLESAEPSPPPKEAIASLAKEGLAFVLHIPHGDCEPHIKCFINEEPPDYLIEKAGQKARVVNSLMHVPSGTIISDGIEFLCFPNTKRQHGLSEEIQIPPGDYRLTVYSLVRWKNRNSDSEFRRLTSSSGRFAEKIMNSLGCLAAAMFPGNLIFAPILILLVGSLSSWRSAIKLAVAILIIDILLLIVFHALERLEQRFPILRQAHKIRETFEQENPDIVLHLARQTDATSNNSTPAYHAIKW